MKLNANKLLMATATVGLVAGFANAETETTYKSTKSSKATSTYGTDYNADDTESTMEPTGASKTKSTSSTTTSTSSPGVMDQSSGTTQDVEVTRMIREELNDNDSLSTAAKNIEVITLNNTVTLRGKVASQDEKQKVASMAKSAAGAKTIKNELTVDTSKR